MNANVKAGGRVNFNSVRFNCPNAQILISVANNGYTTSDIVALSLQGAFWPKTSSGSPIVLWTQKKSQARVIDKLYLEGFDNGAGGTYSMDSTPLVGGWRSSGSVTLTTSTSAPNVYQGIYFTTKAPKPPTVLSFFPAGVSGSKVCVAYQGTPSEIAITLGLMTVDRSNFTSATSAIVNYAAALDEC